MSDRLTRAFAAIDAANARDPRPDPVTGEPEDLAYGLRMTAEQRILYPDADEALQIACRGQHIERWLLPRHAYPDDRAGYLAWRVEQGRRHAARVTGIMAEAGYPPDEVEAAGRMLRKEGIKREADVQAMEDVACFTFLRHYLGPFAATQTPEAMLRIVQKTARKMSEGARARALAEFPMPADWAEAFA